MLKQAKGCVSTILVIIIFIFILDALDAFMPRTRTTPGFQYTGNYPDLYTAAINSILHSSGSRTSRHNPNIRILEKDEFGRIFFLYNESYFSSRIEGRNRGVASRLIIQKTDGNYVYFYEHINLIFIIREPITISDLYFNLTEIEALKYANNWGQELSCTSKFIRIPITSIPETRGPVCSDILIETGLTAFPNFFRNYNIFGQLNRRATGERWLTNLRYFRSDPYGRSVYSVLGNTERANDTFVAFIFQPDHTININTGVIILPNRHDYHTEFRDFLKANGWNTEP